MDNHRANLDQPPQSTPYLVLSIILLILSTIGLYIYFKVLPARPDISPSQSVTSTISIVPTLLPTEILLPTAVPSTPSSTIKPSPTTKPIPTLKPTVSATPSAKYIDYQNPNDNFSVTYSSSRKLYQDTESSGNRYTFYNTSGNIAIHAGSQWSWTNPDRTFSNNFLVDGHNTFRYDIDSQTLVDIQDKSRNYTIQCVHNGLASLKTECDQFIKSFKFLKL